MSAFRMWRDNRLHREIIDGVLITENLGRTREELGLTRTIKTPVGYKREIKPVPYDQWPLWAKALKQFAKPEDKGIGDVVARIIGEENSAAFSAWHLATFGKPCNCKGRQAKWNKLYPLNQ